MFKDVNEAMVATKKMTPTQKERMLLDLVWKSYVKPKGLTTRNLVVQAYESSIIVP